MNDQLLFRELYKIREKIESARDALLQGVSPYEVVSEDLSDALEAVDYLQSYV